MQKDLVLFYVDDDPDDIFMFKDIADQLQVTVVDFLFGEGMLDAMYNPPPKPNMVFVDLNMPKMSGFELINEIKASPFFRDIPVVVLSTANDNRTISQAKRIGADYYIRKPNSSKELREAIAHAISIDWKNDKPTISNFYYSPNDLKLNN